MRTAHPELSEKKIPSIQIHSLIFPLCMISGIAHALTGSRRIRLLKINLLRLGEITMRSDLVFGAMTHVSNRFQLTKLAAKATRKLHRPNTRIQETMNDVLIRFSQANPMADEADEPKTGNVQPFHRAA